MSSKQFQERSAVIRIIIITVGVIFIVRLAILQVFDDTYQKLAEQQALRNITQYPARGLIYDRNGELLVHNEAVYDLMVIPRMVKKLDTALFCRAVGITREEFDVRMKKAWNYSPYSGSPFLKEVSKEEYGSWQSNLYKFHGFYIQQRTLRIYDKPIAAHLLGYVGEVDQNDIDSDTTRYYRQGDYIGKSGLEKSYEMVLRGIKGKKIMHVDVHNREIGSYLNGAHDTLATEGGNLYTTVDSELQEYAEGLIANKRGCIIAVEPSTGEVLAMASAPTYDPNLLVGRGLALNYLNLLRDKYNKPLFNRAIQAQYPPGSTFKVAQALTALDMGVIPPQQGFPCDKSKVGCHNHPSAGSVQEAIKMSCNPYFYFTYRRIILQGKTKSIFTDSPYGLTRWVEYMHRFGFGTRIGIDLPNVKEGRIPDTAFYNNPRRGAGKGKWSFYSIFSNSIGQGEVELVPIQMVNLACIVANRGYYYTPHVVRYYGPDSTRNEEFYQKHETGIARRYLDIAVNGMYDVVHVAGGTARKAYIPDIAICGKTGTAQNNDDDHSAFICFAPKDKPKIAVVVYLENARGGGGSWAAPIASLVVEKYIRGEVTRKEFERMYRDVAPCQKMPLPSIIRREKKRNERK